jgi:hypothetical protein
MAKDGSLPSSLFREVITRCAPESVDQQRVIRYFSEAFLFREGEAYTIIGWLPDGLGKLPDSTLEYHLAKRINKTRSAWDDSSINPPDDATVPLAPPAASL